MECIVHHYRLFQGWYSTEEMRAIWEEENLVQNWLKIEAALTSALHREGIIPDEAKEQILQMSNMKSIDLESILHETGHTRHIISGFIKAFRKKCGTAGEYYHLGTTTQDILDTGLVLMMKESCRMMERDMFKLQDIMIELAKKHQNTVMVGRSQGQHGIPITFGFKAAVWAMELQDHIDRLWELSKRLFLVNLSGAMGTKASFCAMLGIEGAERIEKQVGEELGLECPLADLHHRTDRFAEALNFLALLCSSLGEMGLEIRDLQRTEVAEVAESWNRKNDGSSTMPHKRNPEPSHWLDGLAKIARSNALAMMDIQMQHERDATRTAAMFACIPESFLVASGSLKLSIDILGNLYVDEKRMRENLDLQQGLAMSEAVMFKLFQQTGKKLEAHQWVKDCSLEAHQKKIPLRKVLLEHPEVSQHLCEQDIDEALKPENYLGTIPKQVEAVINEILRKRRSMGALRFSGFFS